MLKLKPQCFGHLMRTDSLEKTLMLGKVEGRRRREHQRVNWWDGIMIRLTWVCASSGSSVMEREPRLSDWTELNLNLLFLFIYFLHIYLFIYFVCVCVCAKHKYVYLKTICTVKKWGLLSRSGRWKYLAMRFHYL